VPGPFPVPTTHPTTPAPIPLAQIISEVVNEMQSQGSLVQMPPESVHHPLPGTPVPGPALSLSVPAVSTRITRPSTPPVSSDMTYSHTLVLGDGKLLYYHTDDVPDPPALNITGNSLKLARMWDDSSMDWDRSSPLVIKDVLIALIHWKVVYSGKVWDRIKQNWHSWKVCNSCIHVLSLMEYRLVYHG
jgi:hypothetical protein